MLIENFEEVGEEEDMKWIAEEENMMKEPTS